MFCIFPASVPAASSFADGVNQLLARSCRFKLWLFFPSFVFLRPDSVNSASGCGTSCVVGVGQDEQPFPFVRCADSFIVCSNTCPFDLTEPERGKIREDGAESTSKKSGDVFKKRPFGVNCPKNFGDIGPEVSVILCPFS